MQYVARLRSKLFLLLGVGAVLLLLLAVACGAAGKPAAPATAPQKEAPAAKASPVPTAAPIAKAAPKEVQVSGKVTLMNSVWAVEQFSPREVTGEVQTYMRPLHAFLITGDEKLQLTPSVLTKWEISPDGKTWTFTVRKGIKFHNGADLTADDVAFSLNDILGKEGIEKGVSPSSVAEAKKTEKVEAFGPDIVKVTRSRPTADFPFVLSEMTALTVGAVLPKQYFEQVGRERYNTEPVAAGPFKLLRHKRSEQMLFERFDDYFNPERRAKFKTLDMRLVPEASTRAAALRSGEADIIEANLASRKQIEGAGGRVLFVRESSYMWVFLPGCWKVELPCHKKEVRHALDYAIDKNLILKQLYGPEAAEAKGWVAATPSALGYSPELDPFPYDPAKAKTLLAQAGFPEGRGFPKLKINTWVAGDVPFMPEQAQLIADAWKKNLGIEVEVVIGEAATVRSRWFAGELDGQALVRPNEGRWDGLSSAVALYADFAGGAHVGGRDPELKRIVEETGAVLDPAKRQEAYNRMYKALREAHYEFSTGYVNLPWGVSQRIATWEPWPLVAYVTAHWTITLK